MQASRRLLLLYNASTFCNKRHTSSTSSNNNNNISKNSNSSDIIESKTGDCSSSMSFDDHEEVYPDPRQQLEVVAAMHRAILEGSLKVRKQILESRFKFYPYNLIPLQNTCIAQNTCIVTGSVKSSSGLTVILSCIRLCHI